MLRTLAIIYCLIEIARSVYRLMIAVDLGVFSNLYPWVAWPINLLGLVAVMSYGLARNAFPAHLWRGTLAAYLTLRVFEIVENGLWGSGARPASIAIYLVNYMYLVLPSLAALFYYSLHGKQGYPEMKSDRSESV